MPKPLLSVGIPTYNRLTGLRAAVESALAQDCGNVEVLIADNASTDGTEDYCCGLAKREPAVRYIRSPLNRGPTANFNTLLRNGKGDYFLFLADDDRLDPSYASTCLAWLKANPDYAMAGGRPEYVRDDGAIATGRPIDLPHAVAAQRVRAYLREVDDGAAIYGVLPRGIVDDVSDIRNVVGNDWLFVAEIAALGKVISLPDARLHRSLGGTSASYLKLAETLGLPAVQGRLPFIALAWEFGADVLWRSAVHRQAHTRRERWGLALLCGASMARRQVWLWILALDRFPPTRAAYRAAKALYLRLDRGSGGRLHLQFPGHSTAIPRPPDDAHAREL